MVKKTNWMVWIAVLALIVAVVALVVVLQGSVTGNAIFSTSSARQINANSCKADDNCEVKKISSISADGRKTMIAGILTPLSQGIYLNSSEGGNRSYATSIIAGVISIIGSEDSVTLISPEGVQTGKIVLREMTGQGNSYLCIDSYGNVFRSDSLCR